MGKRGAEPQPLGGQDKVLKSERRREVATPLWNGVNAGLKAFDFNCSVGNYWKSGAGAQHDSREG